MTTLEFRTRNIYTKLTFLMSFSTEQIQHSSEKERL
jgi:hypothetical protein